MMRIAHLTKWAIPTSTLPSFEITNFLTIQYPKAAPARIIPTSTNIETCKKKKREVKILVDVFLRSWKIPKMVTEHDSCITGHYRKRITRKVAASLLFNTEVIKRKGFMPK
jgi:hypothetical protein